MEIQNLFPEIYRDSRDFRVFIKLLKLVADTTKIDIDDWINIYDPLKCKEVFLPLLADMIGYTYNSKLSVKENRIIMSEFVAMVKNKGSEIGLRLAATLSLNAQLASDPTSEEYKKAVNQLQNLEIYFDPDKGEISIYYPEDLAKVRDLMYYVRPAGSILKFIPTDFPNPASDIAIRTKITDKVQEFDNNLALWHNQIGLSQISSMPPALDYVLLKKLELKENEIWVMPNSEEQSETYNPENVEMVEACFYAKPNAESENLMIYINGLSFHTETTETSFMVVCEFTSAEGSGMLQRWSYEFPLGNRTKKFVISIKRDLTTGREKVTVNGKYLGVDGKPDYSYGKGIYFMNCEIGYLSHLEKDDKDAIQFKPARIKDPNGSDDFSESQIGMVDEKTKQFIGVLVIPT